jgi:HEAT repeat protein
MATARALGHIGDPAGIPGLLDGLRDVSQLVRGNAASALGSIGVQHPEFGGDLLAPLVAALGDRDSGVRALAALALGRVAAALESPTLREEAIPALLNAFRDSSLNVRTNAAWALGRIGPDAVPAMIHALRDEEMQVRSAAASVLKQIGERHGKTTRAVDALIAALNDVDETVRWYAIGALGVIRDPRAVPHLVRILDDTHKPYPFDEMRICDIAAEALERIGTAEAVGVVRAWRASEPQSPPGPATKRNR